MGKIELTPYDPAERMTVPEDVIDLLNDAFESGEAGYIAKALGVAARSEGMSKIAEKAGVNRQGLYNTLSEGGNPTLETLLGVFSALGIKLKCEVNLDRAA